MTDRVTLFGSPRKFLGLQPISSLRIHDHNQGSFRDNKLLNRNHKVDLDNKLEHYQSKHEECLYEPRSNNILFGNLRPETDTLNSNQSKPSMPGMGRIMNCNHASSLVEVSGSEDLIIQKYGSPIKLASSSNSSECRKCDDKMIHHLTSLELLCRQQCSYDELSSDFRGRNEFETTIMPQHEDRDKGETLLKSHKDNSMLIWHRSDYNMNFPNLEKGKAHICSSVEDSMSISKEREDSHGSVESSSSKRVISRCKRPWSPDPKLSEAAINTKRQKNYGSSVRQSRSFKNWVSTITSGYMTSVQDTPLTFVPHPSPNTERHPNSLHKSCEKSKSSNISCKPIGFRSIFQSLYADSLTFKKSTRRDLDTQREVDASEEHEIASEQLYHSLHMACDTYGHSSRNMIPQTRVRIGSVSKEYVSGESLPLVCDGDSNLHNRIFTSSGRRKHDNYHVEELFPTTASSSSKNSSLHEIPECNYRQECHLNNKGPYSFNDNIVPVTTTENKEASIPGSVSNGSLMVSNSRTGILDNLWIRRLFPKVSSSSANTALHNQDTEAASKCETNKCKTTLNRNDVSSNREQNNSKGHSVSDEIQDHSLFPIDRYDSKRIFDQNVKTNLNQILPSQNFKKHEQMASVFAKRLDALRHIRPPVVTDIATSSTVTCYFCGMGGHTIKKCSE